ncbi:MAG: hypothetical protein AAFW89_14840 [Bacteroidota bacterium]
MSLMFNAMGVFLLYSVSTFFPFSDQQFFTRLAELKVWVRLFSALLVMTSLVLIVARYGVLTGIFYWILSTTCTLSLFLVVLPAFSTQRSDHAS